MIYCPGRKSKFRLISSMFQTAMDQQRILVCLLDSLDNQKRDPPGRDTIDQHSFEIIYLFQPTWSVTRITLCRIQASLPDHVDQIGLRTGGVLHGRGGSAGSEEGENGCLLSQENFPCTSSS